MHLVTRGSKTYAYRSVRQGKRVKRIYLGRGVCAQQLMMVQKLNRSKALTQKRAEAEEQAKLWPIQQRMSLIRAEAKQWMEAMYLATGHYRSSCRHWRRCKMDKEKTPELAVHPRAEEWSEEQPQVTEVRRAQLKRNDQLKLLCQQIKAGKPHLRSQLRNLLRQESPEDIKGIADLTELVADRWASQIAPNSEVARGCIVVDAMDQRLALAPPGSTTIEQILASRVVLCSLQQSYHELQMTAVAGNADVTGTKLGNALERRLQDGNRELENATKIYQKGVSLAAEISSPRPQAGVAALKIYNPDAKNRRKSA